MYRNNTIPLKIDANTAKDVLREIGTKACAAKTAMRLIDPDKKARAIHAMADGLKAGMDDLLRANAQDMETARAKSQPPARIDRLMLDTTRIDGICEALHAIADFREPTNRIMETSTRPNGLKIDKVAVPIGVIGVIYESRPNVTADAAALCIKAGNAVILRSSSECLHSAVCIVRILQSALANNGLPQDAVQIIEQPDHELVDAMLEACEFIDVMVPRGGRSLIARVNEKARMPVFSHLDGICHMYVAANADLSMAHDLTINAKMRRVSICGALETLLVDQAIANDFIPALVKALRDQNCEIRGCDLTRQLDPLAILAEEADWGCEYLDAILSIKIVSDLDAAIAHINHYGSHHTDSIVTKSDDECQRFMAQIDSAIVMHNASTQFADGNEFGKGGEIGIATGRIHARGPVGCDELTCFHYRVHGTGQCRA